MLTTPPLERSRAAATAGGQADQRASAVQESRSHGSTTDRVRLRGGSGSRPRATASSTASRWPSTSVASGSAGVDDVAPVRRMSASGRGSIGPIDDDERARVGHRDRAVAVLHRRVGLGPRPAGLAQLQRRLGGQADRPAAAEEVEALEARRVDRAAAPSAHAGRRPRPTATGRARGGRAAAPAPWSRTASGRRSARRRRPAKRPRRRLRERAVGDGGERHRRRGVAGRERRSSSTSLVVPERESASTRVVAAAGGNSEAAKASVSPCPASSREARVGLGHVERGAAPDHRQPRPGRAARDRVASAAARRQTSGWLATSCAIALISRDFTHESRRIQRANAHVRR